MKRLKTKRATWADDMDRLADHLTAVGHVQENSRDGVGCRPYDSRSAAIGSISVARRAGM